MEIVPTLLAGFIIGFVVATFIVWVEYVLYKRALRRQQRESLRKMIQQVRKK